MASGGAESAPARSRFRVPARAGPAMARTTISNDSNNDFSTLRSVGLTMNSWAIEK
jgi:hypothetical protein